jgi:hypothetical protein
MAKPPYDPPYDVEPVDWSVPCEAFLDALSYIRDDKRNLLVVLALGLLPSIIEGFIDGWDWEGWWPKVKTILVTLLSWLVIFGLLFIAKIVNIPGKRRAAKRIADLEAARLAALHTPHIVIEAIFNHSVTILGNLTKTGYDDFIKRLDDELPETVAKLFKSAEPIVVLDVADEMTPKRNHLRGIIKELRKAMVPIYVPLIERQQTIPASTTTDPPHPPSSPGSA